MLWAPLWAQNPTAVILRLWSALEKAVDYMGRQVVLKGMLADILMPDLTQHEGNILLRARVGYSLSVPPNEGKPTPCSQCVPLHPHQWDVVVEMKGRVGKSCANGIQSMLLL